MRKKEKFGRVDEGSEVGEMSQPQSGKASSRQQQR